MSECNDTLFVDLTSEGNKHLSWCLEARHKVANPPAMIGPPQVDETIRLSLTLMREDYERLGSFTAGGGYRFRLKAFGDAYLYFLGEVDFVCQQDWNFYGEKRGERYIVDLTGKAEYVIVQERKTA